MSKATIMAGIDSDSSRVIANNTVEYTVGKARTIRLHSTDVITFDALGGVTLDTGGWLTPTTKDRINQFQTAARLHSERGIWYATIGGKRYIYQDGLRIGPRGGVTGHAGPAAIKAQRKKTKQIKAYCDAIRALDTLPEPEPGDCFICSGFKGTDCLQSHLDEMYIHGSLIRRAMEARGYSEFALRFAYQIDNRDTVVRAVLAYFKANC
jgi:hypothetical protein